MTRIVAGVAKGRRLRTPAGRATRPTTDRVREALFSALESDLGGFAGVRFLDLYAGSGAVGLEAVSRGAAGAVLVERDRRTAALARRNAAELGFDCVDVVASSVDRFVESGNPGPPFGAAFLDPPYDVATAAVTRVLARLHANGHLPHDGVVVVERPTRAGELSWPAGLVATRERAYGETTLWYGRATEG